MKIDIHVHTLKFKAGDSEGRNIEPIEFGKIIKSTDVKILAVTNHNHFDLKQFHDLTIEVSGTCQIWPGIELDIFENGKRAHLLIICNPKSAKPFDKKVKEILAGKTPDNFSISIKDTVGAFDTLDTIYIAHYFAKKPDLGDKEIDTLLQLVSNPKRVLKEATNSLSAGIYISHGHNSIYGSDIHDWKDYVTESEHLPELRLPVESFEQFTLLLEKDEATIDTLLNQKTKENIEIAPFVAAELLKLDIYNDINILFGSKGTGKTAILEALSKYYNAKGYKTSVYKSNDTHLNAVFDIKGDYFALSKDELPFDECEAEIKFLKEATDEDITSVSKYYQHYLIQETNKISQQLKIKNIAAVDKTQPNKKFKEVLSIYKTFSEFKVYVESNKPLTAIIGEKLVKDLIDLLESILTKLLDDAQTKFIDSRSINLLNHIIKCFTTEISKKTGLPQKPITTGFADYARNRIQIEMAIKKLLFNMALEIKTVSEYVGNLGEKGDLYCQTNLKINDGLKGSPHFSAIKNVNKTLQKEFVNRVKGIVKYVYHNDLFEKISGLNEIEGSDDIECISDLVLLNRHFVLNGGTYQPSNGESSMILLHRELRDDKDIYLIDEPEKSLGNDYINDVIVPLLKEKALLGKRVIVATHDANIAVRTLPYNSIYRLHDAGLYYTLTGNPFSNSLKCINNSRPALDWKEISMKTLEGGKSAFGERGKIYGNV